LELPRSNLPERTNTFWLASAGGRWRMVLQWEEGTKVRFCDVGLTADNRVGEVTGFMGTNANKGGVATVHDSSIPLATTGGMAGYLWLALASPPFLKTLQKQPTHTLPCLWDVVRVNNTFTSWWQAAEWRVAGTSHLFPSFISYQNDGTNRTWGTKGLHEYLVPRPFERGFTNAVYEVEEWGESGDTRYPKRSTFTVFGVVQNFSKTHLAPFKRVRLEVTNFSTSISAALLEPSLKPGLPVVDYRAITPARQVSVTTQDGVKTNLPVQAGPVSYVAKTKNWPERSVPVAEYRRITGFWGKVRLWVTVALAVSIAGVLVWRWRRARRVPPDVN